MPITLRLLCVVSLLASACANKPDKPAAVGPTATMREARKLARADFNRLALESALPLFWSDDRDADGALDADELAVIWGMDDTSRADWVQGGAFTSRFIEAYDALVARNDAPAALDAKDKARQEALRRELAQSYFTLVESDFSRASAEDRAVVTHVLEAARIVERIYAKQLGTFGMEARLPKGDGLSRLVYFLHQGPWCSGPATENDPACSALRERPERIVGLYPASLQQAPSFCEKLRAHPNSSELLSPFTVVGEQAGELVAVPYSEFYKEDMQRVANELRAAALAIESKEEAAFKAYLLAAAQAFTDNNWFAADEAWAKMNAQNSKWYLRIGPDEVYFEPCSQKAGFHVSFARINPGSLAWQRKLDPVKGEMEAVLAALAGEPYAARKVAFHLPDFIDVVLNAGDSRSARGATIGQALPNWGPVANEGRGRTVAMTNFYTDADSRAILRKQAASMLCSDAMGSFVDDPGPQVMSTVLHEAGHNLGPSHEYKVEGKTDDQIFGGPLASTLEELKAQTIALYMSDWLVTKNIITREEAERAHLRDVVWAMGHISRGMYDAEGKPKPYSQLAAIQLGFLLDQGALSWRAEEVPASGSDKGCLAVQHQALPAAIEQLARLVLGVKARGDVAQAKQLVADFVDGEGEWKHIRDVIAERWRRFPRASFLYSVRL